MRMLDGCTRKVSYMQKHGAALSPTRNGQGQDDQAWLRLLRESLQLWISVALRWASAQVSLRIRVGLGLILGGLGLGLIH